jgi:hypothetical protein
MLLFVGAIIMASEDPDMSKQGTVGKWHVTLKILQKLKIIRRLECGEHQ